MLSCLFKQMAFKHYWTSLHAPRSWCLCTPRNRSCDIGQYLNFVVFGSGSAGSARETHVNHWDVPGLQKRKELLHENSKQTLSPFWTANISAPKEEILIFMLDCSVKRNSKKFGKWAVQWTVIHSVKHLGLRKLNLEESYIHGNRMKTVKNQPEGFGG